MPIDAQDMIAFAIEENERLRVALTELREYAANVWFDEATATDEERELMTRARAALNPSTTSAEASTRPSHARS